MTIVVVGIVVVVLVVVVVVAVVVLVMLGMEVFLGLNGMEAVPMVEATGRGGGGFLC